MSVSWKQLAFARTALDVLQSGARIGSLGLSRHLTQRLERAVTERPAELREWAERVVEEDRRCQQQTGGERTGWTSTTEYGTRRSRR